MPSTLIPRVSALIALAFALPACEAQHVDNDEAVWSAHGLESPTPDLVGTRRHDLTWLAGTAGGGDPVTSRDTAEVPASTPERWIAYTHDRIVERGVVVSSSEEGELDQDLRDRVARPWLYLHEGVVYDEQASAFEDELGRTVKRYTVVATAIDAPSTASPGHSDRPMINPDLADHAHANSVVRIVIRLRTPAPAVLPVAPAPGRVSFEDAEVLRDARRSARQQRERAFADLPSVVHMLSMIEEAGGTVSGMHGGRRSVAAEVPSALLQRLAQQPDVRRLELDGDAESHGSLNAIRDGSQTNVQQFQDHGYNGEIGTSADTIVGVAEVDGLEDEACFMDDGPSDDCDSDERLTKLFDCGTTSCTKVSDYDDTEENSHGTIVTSIIAADYTQGQGGVTGVGALLSPGWEPLSTGMAKETDVHYYMFNAGSSRHESALDCASGDGTNCTLVDVFNSSNGWTGSTCTPASATGNEDALENLFDAGALPVISAGNNGGLTSSTACTVSSPADTPKAFAVGGLEPSNRAGSYHSWGRMDYPSSKYPSGRGVSTYGGATVTMGGVDRVRTSSVVDLAAIGEDVDYVTTSSGVFGQIAHNMVGTSMAAPVVSGAAASVKDWLLQTGESWIDSPGRLHTVMLAMGDRGTIQSAYTHAGCAQGSRLVCGADKLLGLGRLKLRLLDSGMGMAPWGWHMKTKTHTAGTSDPYRYTAFSSGMGTGTEMAKCVMQQHEDMSGKSDMSLVGLRLRVRDKVRGTCVAGSGTIRWTRYDALYDDKHMVTILDDEVNLEGRCLEVEQDRIYLSSANAITTGTFCYYAGVLDDEEP